MKEHHLEHIINNFTVVPAVNQVELHPKLQQPELVKYCQNHGIILEAWSPLMQGALGEMTLEKIGERHGKSIAQVVLKWHLQKGFIPLPKSVTPSRIKENFGLDFYLSSDEMELIESLDISERIGPDPDEITF
jgi:diketogulonate reductase-like aldo/keto reductase